MKSCPFILEGTIPVTNAEDNFIRAKLSPDGTKLLVTKLKYQGIYIINLQNKNHILKVTDEEKVGYGAEWIQNGEALKFISTKNNSSGDKLIYNIKSKNITNVEVNPEFTKSQSVDNRNEISVSYNIKRRIVEATDGEKTWDITKQQGAYYTCIISPDKTKVLIHKNDGKMYIYALDGSGLLYKLGNGICQSWTPDNKYLIYFISHDNGHYTTDSDIYICSDDGLKKWKLTNTSDRIEKWPHLSENGKKLSFYDMTTKRIYVSNFLKK